MNLLRRGLDPGESLAAGAVAGGAVALEVLGTLALWLVNGSGPFEQRRTPGTLIALGAGAAIGLVVLAGATWLARRSIGLLVAGSVVLAALLWVLLPRQVDVSESFVPRENARWSCTGWSFTHYPVATMDASSTRWCVGLERRIGDG